MGRNIRRVLGLAILVAAAAVAYLAMPSFHGMGAAAQLHPGIGPTKTGPLGLPAVVPSNATIKILYLTPHPNLHAMKALTSSLQSARTFTSSQAPLVATGSSAVEAAGSGSDGLGQVASGGYTPPDVAFSAGPNDTFEMVNLEGEIWSKAGTSLSTFSLASFFGTSTDQLSDPRIVYDPLSGRWFSSILDITSDSVYFGASSTGDPTSTWNIYHVAFADCPDQPKIGMSSDKLVISANDFTNHCGISGGSTSFAGGEYWVVDKGQVTSGATLTKYTDVGPSANIMGMMPARELSSNSTVYLVSVNSTGSSVNSLGYYTITGTASSPTTQETDLPIQATSSPPLATEPDSPSYYINTGDGRVLDAAWYKGKMWVSFNDGCVPSGDSVQRSCLRLIQVDTGGSSVLQDYDLGAAGYDYYYPAVTFDGQGNLAAVFGFSSSTAYPSLAITGQPTYDSADHFEGPVTIKTGSADDTSGRYGDYFSAMADPSNSSLVWVAGEYHSSSDWSTYFGTVMVNSAPVADAGTGQTVSPGTVVSLNGSESSDPDGDNLAYSWSQAAGPSVSLANPATAYPSFTAPSVTSTSNLTFQLVVNDGIKNSTPSDVTIADSGCLPPSSGDWNVTSSCTISSNVTAPANVIVQPAVVLTIPSGLKVSIDFTHYHLLIKSGGGVLIKAGGAIN